MHDDLCRGIVARPFFTQRGLVPSYGSGSLNEAHCEIVLLYTCHASSSGLDIVSIHPQGTLSWVIGLLDRCSPCVGIMNLHIQVASVLVEEAELLVWGCSLLVTPHSPGSCFLGSYPILGSWMRPLGVGRFVGGKLSGNIRKRR